MYKIKFSIKKKKSVKAWKGTGFGVWSAFLPPSALQTSNHQMAQQ